MLQEGIGAAMATKKSFTLQNKIEDMFASGKACKINFYFDKVLHRYVYQNMIMRCHK